MTGSWDRVTGEGLLGLDDPAEWDAAFARGERSLGTAAIGLAFRATKVRVHCRGCGGAGQSTSSGRWGTGT